MATQFGKKIAIHSYGPNGARDAVARDGFAWNMRRTCTMPRFRDADRGNILCAQSDHNRYYIENGEKIGLRRVQRKASRFIPKIWRRHEGIQAGVKFAMVSYADLYMFGGE